MNFFGLKEPATKAYSRTKASWHKYVVKSNFRQKMFKIRYKKIHFIETNLHEKEIFCDKILKLLEIFRLSFTLKPRGKNFKKWNSQLSTYFIKMHRVKN